MARRLWPELQVAFDPVFYLERYPDVALSGMDPLAHFLLYGGPEGRQPGPWFDARWYLAEYPDVAQVHANPLLHYLRHGWKEGRRPNPLFDPESQEPGKPNVFIEFVKRIRAGERLRSGLPFTLPRKSYQVATGKFYQGNPVDIIIPVYSGYNETKRCLESILASTCQTVFRVILVNDASPDPTLAAYLREMAESHGWILIESEENLGFAASVNRGVRVGSSSQDILLLNNDTAVANDWLDRLVAAGRKGRVGTATPFSNNATLASYPKPDFANPLPCGLSTAELDRLFADVNAGHSVAVPTGVGFCLFIRRDCLQETGEFRPEVFGRGYGEENDFCLRSLYIGWEHVVATDVFVYHAGETSFGGEAINRRSTAQETLDRIHPDYQRRLREHSRRDPLKPYRIAVSAERMRRSGRPVILSITHDIGGGVQQYVSELRRAIGGLGQILDLTPTESGAVILRNVDPADDFRVAFHPELDYPELLELLRACGVSRIHVQHLLGHTLDVLRLKRDLGLPLDISIHDYFFVCSRITLTGPDGRYCGESDCGCAGRNATYAPLLNAADRVIAPSLDAANRIRGYFPDAKVMAAAHASFHPAAAVRQTQILRPDSPLTIGILGTMTPHKGLARLRECAETTLQKHLPLRFILIGKVEQGRRREPFFQTGPYNNDALPALIGQNGIDVIWFPAQWPETFSYTLSVCMERGLPVIAPHLGAFTERLAGREWSWTVPWDWNSDQLVEFFVRVRGDHFLSGKSPEVQARSTAQAAVDFYPEKYLSGEPIRI